MTQVLGGPIGPDNWTAEKGGEFVVNPQLRKYDGGERVFDHKDTKRLLRRHNRISGLPVKENL